MIRRFGWFLSCAVVVVGSGASAQTPLLVYHGYLTNDRNVPVTGSFPVTFRLYDAPTGGTVAWEEVKTVTVDNGNMATALGSSTPLTPGLFADKQLYLAVALGTEEIAGRQLVGYAPLALQCIDSRGLGGIPANLSGCVDGQVLTYNASGWTCSAGGGGGTNYTAGAGIQITGTTISLRQDCAMGQVLKWTGSAWGCSDDVTSAGGGGGTVTSVGSGAGLTGGPITTSGSLAVNFAGSGSATTVSRSDHTHGAGDITSGTLPVARGGTGATSVGGAGTVVYSSGSALAFSSAGTSGQVLTSGGTGAPTWSAANSHNHAANQITSGTIASARISGAYTGITGVGTISGDLTTTGEFTYSTAKTRYYMVHASAFQVRTSSSGYGTNWGAGNDRYVTGTGTQHMNAPLYLPHGARVTNLTCTFRDSSGTYDPYVRISNWVSNSVVCGNAQTSGTPGDRVTASTSCGFTINNQNTIYGLNYVVDGACGSNCSLYGCNITYTTTIAQ